MYQVLDNLHMSKSFTSKIHPKHKLYGYSMSLNILIERNVDEFLKFIRDFENADVFISEEDQAIMLLIVLPR